MRASVRRKAPVVSLTSQWSFNFASTSSMRITWPASPVVLITQVPTSSSLVRRFRMASSSSRCSLSGYQFAPAVSIVSGVDSMAAAGAFTVMVAIRVARSTRASTRL
eukprot:Amastigsp_a341910_3.p3 type:complete len:107 gc:universal Amastigsp_a341910_3:212-532(+)